MSERVVDVPPRLTVRCRLLLPYDLPQVFAIELGSFQTPWSAKDWDDAVRRFKMEGRVACLSTRDEQVLGVVCLSQLANRVHVANLAVDPDCRRRGVGRALLDEVAERLGGRRRLATIYVGERNLSAQLFLRACGWRCVRIMPGPAGEESTYGFRLRAEEARP